MTRKNFAAAGAFIAEDRPKAVDLLGFASQLVFTTFRTGACTKWSTATTPNSPTPRPRPDRRMIEFCSVDPRLLPSLYVPFVDSRGPRRPPPRAIERARRHC